MIKSLTGLFQRRRHRVEWFVYSRGMWVRLTLQSCELSGFRRFGCLEPVFLLLCFHCYYRIRASSPKNGFSADRFGGDLCDSSGLSFSERDRSVGDGGSPQRCGPTQSLGSRSWLKKGVSRKP
ncbi:hypothetical protein IGI04_008444 [Brassica rapa subsp. trilocularis]|uniref:Uncharacterized protein n=1 Tax=Brassica rapa subsp. trilocularis TaxID=1813537 RepID=A0ABQ7NMT5_BRACM|nr:hypothetical protein IGI04_008444 [Brassica rapa subsp. trilocularis]